MFHIFPSIHFVLHKTIHLHMMGTENRYKLKKHGKSIIIVKDSHITQRESLSYVHRYMTWWCFNIWLQWLRDFDKRNESSIVAKKATRSRRWKALFLYFFITIFCRFVFRETAFVQIESIIQRTISSLKLCSLFHIKPFSLWHFRLIHIPNVRKSTTKKKLSKRQRH